MAKPKVPIISTDARDQALNFDSAIWRQIENACGVSLPPKRWADIDRATQAFLFFESFEHAPEPLAKVKVILEAHDKAATRFFNELFASPFAGSDAGVYAHHLIEKNFKKSHIARNDAGLDTLLSLLRAFHIACNTSIKQLNEPPASSTFRKGNAWTDWISRLTEILRGAKLPFGVGKLIGNKSRSDQSPFTLLVMGVATCFAELNAGAIPIQSLRWQTQSSRCANSLALPTERAFPGTPIGLNYGCCAFAATTEQAFSDIIRGCGG